MPKVKWTRDYNGNHLGRQKTDVVAKIMPKAVKKKHLVRVLQPAQLSELPIAELKKRVAAKIEQWDLKTTVPPCPPLTWVGVPTTKFQRNKVHRAIAGNNTAIGHIYQLMGDEVWTISITAAPEGVRGTTNLRESKKLLEKRWADWWASIHATPEKKPKKAAK